MLKACSRCGKIHDFSFECTPRNKPCRKKKEATEEQKLRNKSSWHKKSAYIRGLSYNLCAICREEGDYSYKPLEVHHIKPLREVGAGGLLEDDNLIALCVYHHQKADRGDIPRDKLLELARERTEKREGGSTPGGYLL
jgi:5-methylcytosine-specific restriction endonuclease McrA